MAERVLPTGTITFLFSDMVGSTRLVSALGPTIFREILEHHNKILRAAFAAQGGTERGTQGDSFLVMFADAPSALRAAADAQRGLAAARWSGDADVRVRMGVHTGVGLLGGDDYVGLDVHRAARIAAAAHGGQVLVSETTRSLAEGSLPGDLGLVDLGEHTLRDIAQAEHLYQLRVEGLPSAFPPPRTLAGGVRHLPQRLTSFIGRDGELDELGRLLASSRLLTLTGPGGTGKTSLAQELARRHADAFANGAWWIGLDGITDASLVEPTIAATLGFVAVRGGSVRDQLVEFLADRSVLLVLDNFEHLLPAALLVGDLLAATDGLKVIVTSRAPLHLSSEQEFAVEPLSLPGPLGAPDAAQSSPAVRLFVERARRVRPAYELTATDVEAVVDICRRLDGLPLGIELAASRIALLPPQAIAARLASRLDLPGVGARDVPERQQSLERAIAWSFDLLEAPAQDLLARLSVFAGGFRLEEADVVAGHAVAPGRDLLDGLSTLVDQSLVHPGAGPDGPRFRLLDTIRMFAADRLAAGIEEAAVRRRHALAYLALAEAAAPNLPGRTQLAWLDRLDIEIDNLRGAVRWAIAAGEADLAMRLGAAQWRFWQLRGHVDEGRVIMDEILAMPGSQAPTVARVRALEAAGGLAWWASEARAADRRYVDELATARQIGDTAGEADALFNLLHTRTYLSGDPGELSTLQDEAAAAYRRLGDDRGIARLEWTRLQALARQGELERARDLAFEQISRFRELDDPYYESLAAGLMAWVSLGLGDGAGSLRWGTRSLGSYLAMADLSSAVISIRQLAIFLLADGRVAEATTVYAAYEAISSRHGLRPPAFPEQLLPSMPMAPSDVARTLTAPEHADDAARGAAMNAFDVYEYLVHILGERLHAP